MRSRSHARFTRQRVEIACNSADMLVTPSSSRSTGSSGNSALADVTLDLVLRGNVPSVFRQSAEDSERRPSLAIGPTRGQACNHEHKS